MRTVPTAALRTYIKNTYPNASQDMLADVLHLSLHAYQRMLYRPNIRYDLADKYAIRLGIHPCHIWINWYEITSKDNDIYEIYGKVS